MKRVPMNRDEFHMTKTKNYKQMKRQTKDNVLNRESIFFTDEEDPRTYSLSNQFAEHMEFELVKDKITSTGDDAYFALSLAVRDRLVRRWLRTQNQYYQKDVKRVYYLSLEYLMGRLLGNALINMDLYDECYNILKKDGYSLEEIRDFEDDMGLGNGGLGRLAACYLDSMATLELPAFGYGIRYEYGIFEQEIENGYQVEYADSWLSGGNPWDIMRRELSFKVKFYGKVKRTENPDGTYSFEWVDTEDVQALAYDVPIPGYKNNTVNNLRLWQAKASKDFSFKDFNLGNYVAAVASKNDSETISKVLYPNDSYVEGKFLRLKQQYFFVSATLQDIIRKYKVSHDSFDNFAKKTAIQLNDTHPVIAIPELMRILLDEEKISWNKAWDITSKTFAYTNHTVVPEALEEWSIQLFEELLPRHLQIVYEINRRFLEDVKKNYTADEKIISKLSIIGAGNVRMANLAIVGSFAVNGVAALHTKIIKKRIFPHFNTIFPGKFINIKNGLKQIKNLVIVDKYVKSDVMGKTTDKNVLTDYIDHLLKFIKPEAISPMKVVMNAGNGCAGIVLPEILKHLPQISPVPVFWEPDGSFPNGIPNPLLEERREETATKVRANNADLGVAWDGDFDRCFFYDDQGNFVEGYYLVVLFSEFFLKRNPGEKIIHDPRLIWATIDVVTKFGGIPVQSKAGHSFIKERMRKENAVYAGEMSAHHYFKDNYFADNGMLPMLILLQILSEKNKSLRELVKEWIKSYPVSGEINIKATNPLKIIEEIEKEYKPSSITSDYTDGLSLEYDDWRFNLRKSNTEEVIRLNVETKNNPSLMEEKRNELVEKIKSIEF